MGVELRWAVPRGTTTKPPVLQYRTVSEWPRKPGEWRDVPTVVVEQMTRTTSATAPDTASTITMLTIFGATPEPGEGER